MPSSMQQNLVLSGSGTTNLICLTDTTVSLPFPHGTGTLLAVTVPRPYVVFHSFRTSPRHYGN